jgi:hypothetical protein
MLFLYFQVCFMVIPRKKYHKNREGQLKEKFFKYASKFNLSMIKILWKSLVLQSIFTTWSHDRKSYRCRKTLACYYFMKLVKKIKGKSYVVDHEVTFKDDLYGKLVSTLEEWTDGAFTGILRKIIDNARVEISKRHRIIFDGDVDPE